MRAAASSSLPLKMSFLTFGRFSRDFLLLLLWGPPLQKVSSFNRIFSSVVPPYTIPPRCEFPIGRASSHCWAGALYQSRVLLSELLALAIIFTGRRNAKAIVPTIILVLTTILFLIFKTIHIHISASSLCGIIVDGDTGTHKEAAIIILHLEILDGRNPGLSVYTI